MPGLEAELIWLIPAIIITIVIMVGIIIFSTLFLQRRLRTTHRDKIKSELQYSELFNTVTDIVFVHSPEGIVLQVNNAITRCLGYQPHEIINQSLRKLLLPEDQEDLLLYLNKIEEKEEFKGQITLRCKNNEPRIFEYSNATVKKDGKFSAVRGIARDVTEKFQIEHELRQSEERYRLLTDFSPLPVVVQIRYRIVYINDAGLKMLGAVTGKNVIGKYIYAFIKKKNRDAFKKNIREAARKGKGAFVFEQTIFGLDGKVKEVEVLASQIIYDGQNAGQVIIRDITEQKELHQKLAQAERLETAGQIAGQIAHDFNSLLAPLTAYPTLLRSDLPAGHKSLELIHDMETAASRIAEINQQLLSLGRRGHYRMEAIDLNELIRELPNLKAFPKGVKIKTFLSPEISRIKGGTAQLTRALTNLVQNAVEAMQNVGILQISTKNVSLDLKSGLRETTPKGEYVKLEIADTGPGISSAIQKKIYDPFFSTKKMDNMRGSGLGLSIVHGIVEDHEGHIFVDSTPGQGSRFSLYFPVFKTKVSRETPSSEVPSGIGEKLLIIDDDPVQRRVAEQLLKRLGYRVTSVPGGEEGVELLQQQPQELIILDMKMGGIDGTETFRQILKINPSQKAIVMSGYPQSKRVQEAQKLGVDEFIHKPIVPNLLAKAIHRVLKQKTAIKKTTQT